MECAYYLRLTAYRSLFTAHCSLLKMRYQTHTHERNYGCRLRESTYREHRCVTLENESLRVMVAADKGADILEFLHNRRGRERRRCEVKVKQMCTFSVKGVCLTWLVCWLALAASFVPARGQNTRDSSLHNESYQVRLLDDASLEITPKRAASVRAQKFAPRFTVMRRDDDPTLRSTLDRSVMFKVPIWKRVRDGKDTSNFFEAANAVVVTATKGEIRAGKIVWMFTPPQTDFNLEAEVRLPNGRGEPRVTFRFTPRRAGFYSVGYTGAPETPAAEIASVWQPLVWQERRFPSQPYLSMEHMCPLPAVLVERAGATVGVVADPQEAPFRLPGFDNARFGVLVRNERGNAQPMIFAPVLGHPPSRMAAGQAFDFNFQLTVQPGGWFESYRHIARGIFGFRDYRENATGSLNDTLENMIAFVMDDRYSGWVEDLKAFDYTTDVPGSVKLVSALHPLSLALVTDSEEIYRRRALPMIEYLMSRQKYLFATKEDIKGQNASYLMKGPAAEVSELSALFQMSSNRSRVFRHYAEALYDKPRALNLNMISEGASWQNALAFYRMTGERRYLEAARDGANLYVARRIDQPQTDFSDARIGRGGQFWSDFAPKWVDLLELYEETKERKYLDAAAAGAKLYAAFVWLQPVIPARDVVINEGGKVGKYNYGNRLFENPQPMRAPEQRVPAWRVSQIGLTPEAANTYEDNPAIMLTHYAAYMLRLASYTNDNFFRDIARSAVVGRYANYPGYDINGEYTTIYGRPDYPLRPFQELTYNNIYYNHVWPHIALVTDYLLSEAFVKSDGRINFPARYAQGYAYLQSKVYGDRAGEFYTDRNVQLWMPAKLLRTDEIQANYVAGYGNDNFYLALFNQSARPVTVRVRLNPDIVPVEINKSYAVRTWQENKPGPQQLMKGGEVTVTIKEHGITALAVDGLKVVPQFQQKVFGAEVAPLSDASYREADSPFGKVTGMLISMGADLTSAFVWLEATEKQLRQAKLRYRLNGVEKEIVDARYPFEFSVPLKETDASFTYTIEGTTTKNETVVVPTIELKR